MKHALLRQDILQNIPSSFWLRNKIVPIGEEGERPLTIGTTNAEDELWALALQANFSEQIKLEVLSDQDLEHALEDIRSKDENEQLLGEISIDPNDLENLGNLKQASESGPVIRLVDNLIHRALFDQATDIHFEPDEDVLRVRYRVDGMLRDNQVLPVWVTLALVSRIKIMAELDIAQKRIPQDGRIKWTWQEEELDLRVSTLPVKHGEKVVVRVLKQNKILESIDSLGFPPDLLDRFKFLVDRPQGMLFVTGPTGSGKSSTLYAALRGIVHKPINITTIEDPIEYELERANQVQIHPKAGLTFASALRSLLRQDPDVILLGETRDSETAQIAIQAAQTGHLVLSTLHTNDAASAINRLRDLGIPSFLISSSVLGVLAQRLVRKVCPDCIVWRPSTAEELKMLPQLPPNVPYGMGCPSCGNTGYRGRMAVFELLEVGEEIRALINDEANETQLRKSGSYPPLLSDGLRKLELGLTSVEEIVRVLLV